MRTIFWNVDTQKDFMNKDGKLYVEGAEEIKPSLARLTQLARDYKIQVVNTADWHNEETEEISESPDFVNTFPEHCMEWTEGAEYIDETLPRTNCDFIDWRAEGLLGIEHNPKRDIVIYKDKFDVFTGSPHTEEILERLKPDRVFVYGVAKNVCDDYAVMGLIPRVSEVYFVNDAMQGLPGLPDPEEKWLAAGAKKTTVRELEEMLENYR